MYQGYDLFMKIFPFNFQHRHMISFHFIPFDVRTRVDGWSNKLCVLQKGRFLILSSHLFCCLKLVAVFFFSVHSYNVAVSNVPFCIFNSIESFWMILWNSCSFAVSHWKIWYECLIIARVWCHIRNIFTIDEWWNSINTLSIANKRERWWMYAFFSVWKILWFRLEWISI